jgi:hypothetical protein
MREVYFDTNVYSHLDSQLQKKNLTAYNKLRRAVLSDQLRIYTSLVVYEETTTALLEYPSQGLRRIRLIRKLSKRKKMIRIHFEILADDIRSYAKGEAFKSQFMSPPPSLHELYEHRPIDELIEAAKQTKDYIRGYRNNVREAYATHIAPLAKQVIANKEVPTFEENYRELAVEFVRSTIRKSPYKQECEEKGLDDLLRVPSMNSMVGAQLSIIYANTYQNRLQSQGDSRDVQHVQLASAVGSLVTEDAGLLKVVRRMDSPYIKAMKLDDLLQSLP